MSEPLQRPEWDSATYHRISAPHVEWGKKVLAKLTLRGDETVLDAGCGTGRLTAELLERLPRGRVVALDISENMLRTARDYLQERYWGRVEFVRADLLGLPFQDRFDGIFSTATFHWVLDHDALFQNLHRALRPGGWLCAQCGGGPNLARLMARIESLAVRPPFSVALDEYEKPIFYTDAEAEAERLQRAGFTDIETGLESAPTRLENAAAYIEFVRTVILRHHLERLPNTGLRDLFMSELARQAGLDMPPYELDYWRLNMWARKQG
ncbi:MAG: methyltransferase domain-containing protein [Acidobacteriia bacterium]|nr:methyltransferase domain-containing protein [Terriglobia bacterium]